MSTDTPTPLLKVDQLKVYFPILGGRAARKVGEVKAVDDVSFVVNRGETVGLVGESGSGKTTVGRAIIRLTEPTAGVISYDEKPISKLSSGASGRIEKKSRSSFRIPIIH